MDELYNVLNSSCMDSLHQLSCLRDNVSHIVACTKMSIRLSRPPLPLLLCVLDDRPGIP